MDFIPIEYYTASYFYFLLIITLLIFAQSLHSDLSTISNIKFKSVLGYILLILLILYMGLRPISFAFGDMGIYFKEFNEYVAGKPFDKSKDYLFEYIKFFFAKTNSPETFFFVCTLLYVLPLYFVCRKLFVDYWFYGFFILISSFSFWAYGVNGIRNGIGTSLFLFAITRERFAFRIALLITTILFHKSLIVPVVAYFIATNYRQVKFYFYCWLLAIPISFVLGGFWESFFLGFDFGETKLDNYLGEFDAANEGVEVKVGFRLDFIFYSATGVFAAWYYLFKQKYQDRFYLDLVRMYLTVNAFWILIIRANYSNRFAYLSWFMLGLIIIYPLLKVKLLKNQHRIVGRILLFYFIFTFILCVIFVKDA